MKLSEKSQIAMTLLEKDVLTTNSNRVAQALVLLVFLSASVAWAEELGGPESQKDLLAKRIMTNSIGMKLVYVEPGEFMMGSAYREDIVARYGGERSDHVGEEPIHLVQISEGFWIGRTEVTRRQFRRFVEETGYETTAEQKGYAGGMSRLGWRWVKGLNWKTPGIDQTDEHPVVQVSWFDAAEFCKWLSKKEQRPYSLPTEAQWEYACRAGSETAFPWGDDIVDARHYGNMADQSMQRWINSYLDMPIETSPWDDGYPTTCPVASFKPNAWGIYDMHGNACEWCRDWYGEDYYLRSTGFDPEGPKTGQVCVLRGGSWVRLPRICRSASRHSIAPTFRSVGRGFRVILLTNAK